MARVRNLRRMDKNEQTRDTDAPAEAGQPSIHECECPEPCNCDHENE